MYSSHNIHVKEAIALTGDVKLFPELGISKTTAEHWVKTREKILESDNEQKRENLLLQQEIYELRKRVSHLESVVKLFQAAYELFVPNPEKIRVKNTQKHKLLEAIEVARGEMPLVRVLEHIGLSKTRYLRWLGKLKDCCLGDYVLCPKKHPRQLKVSEVKKMKELYFDRQFTHYTLPSLALMAQRTGKVICSVETWRRYARVHCWARPKKRVYPCKNKEGVRAKNPGEIFHMDVTEYRLPCGEKCYVQVIIPIPLNNSHF